MKRKKMAHKIGEPIIVSTVEYKVHVPKMLAEIATSEKHGRLLQAIVATGGLLQQLAERSLEVNDPETLSILIHMGLLHPIDPSKEYDDI
jgi:hypothetical protein